MGETSTRTKAPRSANADYELENKRKKELGDRGEALVIIWEQQSLREKNREDLANKVRKVPDGEGFDILSYYPDGREKLIEVKTTRGIAECPFFLSANEYHMMREYPHSYCLYRLYNYDELTDTAEFFWLEKDLVHRLILEAIQYRVVVM